MCKLSFETCVCFIFLVIVAFLSCSGFRIDKLAMTDISKRNSFTSSSLGSRSDQFLTRLVASSNNSRHRRSPHDASPETPATRNNRHLPKKYSERRHRIRHASKQRFHEQAGLDQQQKPTGWIDAVVFPPFGGYSDSETRRTELNHLSSTMRPSASERFAQIPSSGFTFPEPTVAIVNRPQRSPQRNKSQRNKGSHCQEQDVGRKAYHANTVVLAKAESMSSNREKNSNYSVTFRILKQYKSKENLDDTIRLTFSFDKPSRPCEIDIYENALVKINIKQSKEYFLFLKSDGMHNYSVLGMPQLHARKNAKKSQRSPEEIIKKVCGRKFVPRLHPPSLTKRTQNNKRNSVLKLMCTVKGFPLPVITWKFNGTNLRPDARDRRRSITYKRKQSTLRIKSPRESDAGLYECYTRGVDGREYKNSTYYHHDKRPSIPTTNNHNQLSNSENPYGPPCNETYRDVYCHNGGTCFISSFELGEMSCMCPEQYTGTRCREKTSMYHERTYTCKLGLSTTYYC